VIKVLSDKRIVLGVSGGIAAYKTATLCSRLVQAGAILDVVMTEAANRFITPLTFQALTHRRVYTSIFELPAGENIPHIGLAESADLMIIAPATGNTLAKLANGLADNLLAAIALATLAPLLLAPAMETDMWRHPATQRNVQDLVEWGATLVGPDSGYLASGSQGEGRMAEPDQILDWSRKLLARAGDLAGRKIVVSAGGTREPIDPVRYVSNHSTGKMGYAIALAARDRGAEVSLVSTVNLPDPIGVTVMRVGSAAEMRQAVLECSQDADALVMAAAVADYRPVTAAEHKIKKKEEGLTLTLVRTADILADVAAMKTDTGWPRVTVGFAAETRDLLDNARQKLQRKRLDLIAANDVSASDAGFAVDTNRVTLLSADGSIEPLPLLSKFEVGDAILDQVVTLLQQAS
jgi:phosphopantothenoylcysteine decarboxylase / phosphopantothenate---cysteine ligase